MKPTTLINNLQKCLDSTSKKNLPVTLIKCDGFGSLFYGKTNPSDLDCIVFYSISPEQRKTWEIFHNLVNQNSPTYHELHNIIWKYYAEDIPFQTILQTKDVLDYMKKVGINSEWLSYFSYSELFNDPYGMFYPSINGLIIKMIKKGVAGLGCLYPQNIDEKSYHSAQNFVFVWSPEHPNINENLANRTNEEKMEFTKREIDHFNSELDELIIEYTKHLSELEQNIFNNNVKINTSTLKNIPKNISLNGNEEMCELVNIATTLREGMKKIRKMQIVVCRIDWCVRVKDRYGYTIKEHIEFEIPKIAKREVEKEFSEKIMKEILA
jgi:hypothetical protein